MKSTYRLFCVLAMVLLLGACGKKAAEATAAEVENAGETAANSLTITEAQASKLQVRTGPVTPRAMHSTIRAQGLLDVPPQNMVSIAAPFGGFLKRSTLLQGTQVRQGQVIATLEHPDFITMQQEYLENKSQSRYLEAEFKRQTELALENVNARKTLEKARADHEAMMARLSGQRAKLEMLHIDLAKLDAGEISKEVNLYAPITGYVTAVNVNVGSHLAPTDVLFKIADTGHLHAELTVYEHDIPKLAIGQTVSVHVGNESKERTGTVHLLGREVGEDRSIKVHVHFDEEDPSLIPGTFLNATIDVAATDLPSVPDAAVVAFEGKEWIFADRGNRSFEMIEVKVLQRDAGFAAIQMPDGGPLPSTVVVEGAYGLLSTLKNTEEE